MHFRPSSLVAFVTLLLWSTALHAQQRQEISLDGRWQSVTTTDPAETPPADGWQQTTVPGTQWNTPEGGSKYVWYKRPIEVPASTGEGRVYVDLRGALYTPRIYVDGKLAGTGADGWSPTLVEITSMVKPRGTHELAVRCQDRGTYFPEGFVLKPGMSQDQQRGKLLGPVGGYKEMMGLWDRAWLKIVPKQHLQAEELVILPSVRQSSLTIKGKVAGAEGASGVSVAVMDSQRKVLEIPAGEVRPDGTFEISASFPDARKWSPEDPHLYSLVVSVFRGPTPVDEYRQRFGFKEVWIEGPDFYLNGVKRHLLATSTWPVQQYIAADEVRRRIRLIKGSNAITFRTHTQPWPELWMDIADEEGLLMVPEAAVYTDQFGMYGYTDPRFWENYQKHIEGMIKRDRNHASTVLYSLGNEIAFMGMQRYDPQLAKHQGDLARFARKVDPHHPLTFEADLDPDGAYDVIGLHYPHEMPQQRDYPNTTDWLAQRKEETEAAGGMLGQQSARGFLWDRKKPLYIGEYLWVPHEDYSVGTIWNGEKAILNRDLFHDTAKYLAWNDQTIGYRRAGVSALCPWTAFEFGAVQDSNALPYLMQKRFYAPLAAFWKTRARQFFSGEKATLQFDVFNDTATPRDLRVEVLLDGKSAASQAFTLTPAEYRLANLEVTLPEVSQRTAAKLEMVLWEGDKAVDRLSRDAWINPRRDLQIQAGRTLIVYDPSGKWPGSVKSLETLARADAANTILVVAAGALDGAAAKSDVPVIGGGSFDTRAFRAFVEAGGRAVVLEQQDLSGLGLGVATRDSNATMTFAIDAAHPVLKDLAPEDLWHWRDDNYVSRRQIVRPSRGGAQGITVSGGPDWLANSPILEMPVGKGHVVLVQALVGAKLKTEPIAGQLLQNAVDYLSSLQRTDTAARVIGDEPQFAAALKELGVAQRDNGNSKLLVLSGGGNNVVHARGDIERVLAAGGTVYWHAPATEAFAQLRQSLEADGLRITQRSSGISLAPARHLLLRGISREDVLCTSRPTGWDRQMKYIPEAARAILEPEGDRTFTSIDTAKANVTLDGAERQENALVFNRAGTALIQVDAPADGVYELRLNASGTEQAGEKPLLMIRTGPVETSTVVKPHRSRGSEITWFSVEPGEPRNYPVQVPLVRGANEIAIRLVNGERWTRGRTATLHSMAIAAKPSFKSGVELLTIPAAVATWKVGEGRVVIDGVNWDRPWPGATDPRRFASALFANLGASFEPPQQAGNVTTIPLKDLKLIGESAYLNHGSDQISCYNNATFETPFECMKAGDYKLAITAHGAPAGGVHPMLKVLIDGKPAASLEINSATDKPFETAAIRIAPGRHTLQIAYDNDAVVNGEDRNLFIRKIEFAQ